MNDISSLGKIIILIGLAIVIFGAIILLISRVSGGRGWPLPGDIVVHRGPVTIFFPIVTMIIVSIILTLLAWLFFSARR